MLSKLGILLLFLALTPAVASSSVQPPEKLFETRDRQVYTLKFIDTSAGEFELETLEPTTWKGRPAYHFRATVKSIGIFWWIYPFKQVADIYFDREKNVPLFVDISIRERKKQQSTQIKLDSAALRGEEIENSTEPDQPPHHRKKAWDIPKNAQSIFSVLHFLRLQQLAVGKTVSFPVSHDEKNGMFEGEVLRTETIKVPRGEKEALVVRVNHEFAQKFRNSIQDAPLIWLSNDKHKRLLRMEFKHRRGKVIAVLDSPLAEHLTEKERSQAAKN